VAKQSAAGTSYPKPRVRLLFDELLPPRVARALYELGFHATHVKGPGQPPQGAEDQIVLDHAKKHNQTIVTYNHDMLLLCAEQNESVVWLDPRGRRLNPVAIVLRVFTNVEEWQEILRDHRPICVRSMATKNEALPLERAAELMRGRLKRRRAQARQRERQQQPSGATLGL
jgi:predicted nuclease of predicted toxin-antitoxin system